MKAMESPTKSFLESLISSSNQSFSADGPAAKIVSASLTSVTTMQRVNCPTCGGSAERYRSLSDSLVRTQCDRCDYLMVLCADTGRVVEAYAPSFAPAALAS